MTQDEIIEMAREAGVISTKIDGIERFANLVAAHEREECAKVCDEGLFIATSLNALDEMEIWGEKFATAIRQRGQA